MYIYAPANVTVVSRPMTRNRRDTKDDQDSLDSSDLRINSSNWRTCICTSIDVTTRTHTHTHTHTHTQTHTHTHTHAHTYAQIVVWGRSLRVTADDTEWKERKRRALQKCVALLPCCLVACQGNSKSIGIQLSHVPCDVPCDVLCDVPCVMARSRQAYRHRRHELPCDITQH